MSFGRPRDLPKSPHFTRYTPLSADRSRTLEEALNADLMTAPKRTTTIRNADQINIVTITKFFTYNEELLGHKRQNQGVGASRSPTSFCSKAVKMTGGREPTKEEHGTVVRIGSEGMVGREGKYVIVEISHLYVT